MTYLKQLFDEYNAKHFENKITMPIDIVANERKVRNQCGFFKYPVKYAVVTSFGLVSRYVTENAKIVVYVNNRSMKTVNDVKETLLHEMVHAYLFQLHGKGYCGHNSHFKARLSRILRAEFGEMLSVGNVRFKQRIDDEAKWLTVSLHTKEVPVSDIIPPQEEKKEESKEILYRVISNGKIGKFVRESMAYGRKHITLELEDYLFNFTCPIEYVEKV